MKKAFFIDQIKNFPYITKQNLGLVLGKSAENLKYWIREMTQEGTLIPIKNGFFIPKYYYDIVSAVSSSEKEKYLLYLANGIRQPSYVSLEYVLSKYGFLAESTFAITSITLKSTRNFFTPIGTFYYQNLKKELFSGYEIKSFRDKQLREATFAKALFDYLYLRKFSSKAEMKEYLLNSGRLNWDSFREIDKKEFKEIVKGAGSTKLNTIVLILEKAKIL